MSTHSFWDPNLPSISSYPFPNSHIFPLRAATAGGGVVVPISTWLLAEVCSGGQSQRRVPVAPTFILFQLPNVMSMIRQRRAERLSFP